MKGDAETLSRRQERAIATLISEPSISESACSAGVGVVTLWRWMKLPQFKEQYRVARREAVSQAICQLQGASTVAVWTLKDIAGNRVLPSSARVAAAKTILEMSIKGIELEDLAIRVEDLELHVTKP